MLTKSCIHSVRALVVLAELPKGQYRGASAIAEVTSAPANYLGKLLQSLSRQGLVKSQKGLGGGFRLAKRPEKISLFDVVQAIEDLHRWSDCILGLEHCSDKNPCAVHHRWGPVRDAYLRLLKKTYISDLVPKK